MLLWWNRQTRFVRFACTRGRDIWVHADLPVAAVDERAVDRLLGPGGGGRAGGAGPQAALSRSRSAR